MQTAVGAIIISKSSKRILLNKRSSKATYSNYWGFVGGKVEDKEEPIAALYRELFEEINLEKDMIEEIIEINIFNSNNNFTYYSFIVFVKNEFIPQLNNESCGYAWLRAHNWPKCIHPGANAVLSEINIDEILKGA